MRAAKSLYLRIHVHEISPSRRGMSRKYIAMILITQTVPSSMTNHQSKRIAIAVQMMKPKEEAAHQAGRSLCEWRMVIDMHFPLSAGAYGVVRTECWTPYFVYRCR